MGQTIKWNIILRSALVCWVCAPSCFAQGNEKGVVPPTVAITPDVLPQSLSGLFMNMPLKAFLKTHPTVKRLAFLDDSDKIDENQPDQVLFDKLNASPFFTDVLYQFRNSRLIKLGAFSLVEADTLKAKRKVFLAFLIAKYGAPISYAVVEQNIKKERYASPALVWQQGDTFIVAAFPSAALVKSPSQSALELKFAAGTNLSPSIFFGMPPLNKVQQEKILNPVRLEVKNLLLKTMH